MRTNVLLDNELIREAVRLSGLTSENDAVAFALKEFAAARKRLNLLELAGKIKFQTGYDHKAMRKDK
ncbi:MAG: type II toxin-antitoxin system VapB family antitoxin [Candidatus Electrothrix aestuarii]|uniref:Type II toxin-antitoxin system VapB family antitoxin n=1 Tax=Candidatus Electrothrix aestuarii TaxID=3062594 RepID=A0AAU8LQ52_9BACT|nr:type II toxin-antitoxin system VapB family antitoxin [Candidatus Electrothrix aestuarii]